MSICDVYKVTQSADIQLHVIVKKTQPASGKEETANSSPYQVSDKDGLSHLLSCLYCQKLMVQPVYMKCYHAECWTICSWPLRKVCVN